MKKKYYCILSCILILHATFTSFSIAFLPTHNAIIESIKKDKFVLLGFAFTSACLYCLLLSIGKRSQKIAQIDRELTEIRQELAEIRRQRDNIQRHRLYLNGALSSP